MKNLLLLSLILLAALSCSKNDDSVDVPDYVGAWERTWTDDGLNKQFLQHLEINEHVFNSTVYLIQNNLPVPHIEFEGTHAVIDRTLEAVITKIGTPGENGQMEYKTSSVDGYNAFVYENLNIHSKFIGFYILQGDELELVLDFNNDSIAGGNEGSLVFERVKTD